MEKSDIHQLTEKIKQFRDERDWLQFHNHKDMALSLVLEAAEVLEHFQWKSVEECERHAEEQKDEIADELANWTLPGLMDTSKRDRKSVV